jgi:hypothetical protein
VHFGTFLKCIENVEVLHEFIVDLRQIGNCPFLTMGITMNFSNLPHIDKNDFMVSYISWFHDNWLLNLF